MTRRSVITGAALVLLTLSAGLIAARFTGPAALGQVYTVAAVQAGLTHHPRAWIGRIIAVRGVFVTASKWQTPNVATMFCDAHSRSCPLVAPDGQAVHLALTDTARRMRGAVLWQTPSPPGFLLLRSPASPDPVAALIQHVPGLGFVLDHVPGLAAALRPPRLVRAQAPHVVRIQIVPPRTSCQGGVAGPWPCDDAVLLEVRE